MKIVPCSRPGHVPICRPTELPLEASPWPVLETAVGHQPLKTPNTGVPGVSGVTLKLWSLLHCGVNSCGAPGLPECGRCARFRRQVLRLTRLFPEASLQTASSSRPLLSFLLPALPPVSSSGAGLGLIARREACAKPHRRVTFAGLCCSSLITHLKTSLPSTGLPGGARCSAKCGVQTRGCHGLLRGARMDVAGHPSS